jgi:crossover junction endodeoxyribonuclease RusA
VQWTLLHPERPFTLNAERTWHHHKRAKIVRQWREAFAVLAAEAAIPGGIEAIEVEATPYLTPRGRTQDVAACMPAVKAAIDGLVDAGVIEDDSPKYLKSLTFNAPIRCDENSLVLVVRVVP